MCVFGMSIAYESVHIPTSLHPLRRLIAFTPEVVSDGAGSVQPFDGSVVRTPFRDVCGTPIRGLNTPVAVPTPARGPARLQSRSRSPRGTSTRRSENRDADGGHERWPHGGGSPSFRGQPLHQEGGHRAEPPSPTIDSRLGEPAGDAVRSGLDRLIQFEKFVFPLLYEPFIDGRSSEPRWSPRRSARSLLHPGEEGALASVVCQAASHVPPSGAVVE